MTMTMTLTKLRPLTLALLLAPLASACILTIDDSGDDGGDDNGSETGDGDGDPGDGDGDPTTGDGDGDPTTGDGDGDPTTGDGDGDPTTGDGDGDPGACAAMDAMQGDTDCALPLGWAWDGEACFEILCSCTGSECEALFEDQATCEAAYAECLPDPCAAFDATPIGDCDAEIGWTWDGDSCELLNGCECEGPDCEALYETVDACEAGQAACIPGAGCEPDDAAGEGLCDAFFGWAWDGQSCSGISGCNCVGSDCDSLSLDLAECEAAHAQCG